MIAPCKDCPDRKVGCHAVCEKYIAYSEWRTKLLESRWKENEDNDYMFKLIAKKARRARYCRKL